MKKRLALLLGLVSVIVLASCSGGGSTNTPNPQGTGDWGAPEVSKNIEAEQQEQDPEAKETNVYNVAANEVFERKHVVNANYAQYGLLVLRNDSGYLGFYSLNHNKYLIERQFIEKAVQYTVTQDNNVGYLLKIVYDDILYVYDALGNKVYESDADADLSNIANVVDITSTCVNKKVYLTVEDETETVYYEYNTSGAISKVNKIPTQVNVVVEDDTPTFNKNSRYVDIQKIDLKKYGFDGYYLSAKGELFTVFDTSNTPKSTFTIPTGAKVTIAGGKLIYQNAFITSDDETNYSYFDGNHKYIVETYQVNLLSGEKKALNTSYILNNVLGPYMDKDGVYNFALVTVKRFDNKVLRTNEMVILNSEGVIVSNLNGYEPDNFVRIGTGYYNTETKVLYDGQMKEIAYLSAINPTFYPDYNCFIGTINNKYGVVNSSGNVLVPFEYTSLYANKSEDGFIFGVKNDNLYRVDLKNGTETLLANKYTKYDDYVYITETQTKVFNIEFVKNFLLTNVNADRFDTAQGYSSSLYKSNVVVFTTTQKNYYMDTNTDRVDYRFVNVTPKKVANATTFTTIGNNLVEKVNLGETREEAQKIAVGTNKLILTRYNGNYFEFTPEEDGFYNLPRYYKNKTVNVTVSKYNEPVNETANPTYTPVTVNNEEFGNIVRLEKGNTYYFLVSTDYTTKGAIYLDLTIEAGEHPAYPAVHKLEGNQTFQVFENGTYIQINAKGLGLYHIATTNNIQYTVQNNNLYNPANPEGYTDAFDLNRTELTGKYAGTYYGLGEFKSYVVKVTTPSYYSGKTFNFGVELSEPEEINPKGVSITNPYVLEQGDNKVAYTALTYYVYHTTMDGMLRLSATDSSVFNGYSSLAKIYNGEYNPTTNAQYETVYNGGAIEVTKDTDVYIRIYSNINSDTYNFTLNVEEFNSEVLDTTNFSKSSLGAQTLYIKPYSNGMYTITLNARENDTLTGYDIYNQKICELVADQDGQLAYSHYLNRNAVYKLELNTARSQNVSISNSQTSQQWLIPSEYNTAYINGSTSFMFTPAESGLYSFKSDSNLSLCMISDSDEVIATNYKNDNGRVYLAELDGEKTYAVVLNATNAYGQTNVSVIKEIGQNWYAPKKLTTMQEYDLTAFLAELGEESSDFYATMYHPKEASIKFTGFDKYGSSDTAAPSSNIYNPVNVTNDSTIYLHATVDKDNTVVKSELSNDSSVEAGTSIYKPLISNESPMAGTSEGPNSHYYFKAVNSEEYLVFVIVDVDNLVNVSNCYIYDEEYRNIMLSSDNIFSLKPGQGVVIEIICSQSGEYSVGYEIKPEGSVDFETADVVLTTDNPVLEEELIFNERTYVKLTLSADEGDLTVTLSHNGNEVERATLVLGKATLYYTFNALQSYKIKFEGTGTFTREYDSNPLNINKGDDDSFEYDEEAQTYTSTNKEASSQGYTTITTNTTVNISFDVLASCGTNDQVIIDIITGGVTQRAALYNYNEDTQKYSTDLDAGQTLKITYKRSSSTAQHDNEVVISNISYTVEDAVV